MAPRSQIARAALIAVFLAVISACGGAKYSADFSPEADFAAYKTYAWNPRGNNLPDDVRYNNEIIQNRITRAIDKALASKGFRQAPAESADVLVAYHAAVNGRMNNETVVGWYGYPYYGYYGGYYAVGMAANYWDEGTLIVDLLENGDGGEDQLVWRGVATAAMKESAREADQMDTDMERVVAGIFGDYPPTAPRR